MKKENTDFYLAVLGEGEEVVNVTDNVVAVRGISGEVRVYRYSVDIDGSVRLGGSFVIAHHNKDLLASRCLTPEGLPF